MALKAEVLEPGNWSSETGEWFEPALYVWLDDNGGANYKANVEFFGWQGVSFLLDSEAELGFMGLVAGWKKI
jgi:hypothetical protein